MRVISFLLAQIKYSYFVINYIAVSACAKFQVFNCIHTFDYPFILNRLLASDLNVPQYKKY